MLAVGSHSVQKLRLEKELMSAVTAYVKKREGLLLSNPPNITRTANLQSCSY
jgi:hypothetical protein